MRMHADQVDVSVATVEGLVADQFPEWRQLPVRPVRSHGTVNALFRLGEDVVLRFPLQPRLGARHRAELVREQALAREIAPQVPVAVPEPLGLGEPGEGYAGPWTAYRWIEGDTASPESIPDETEFARGLADFVASFRAMPTGGRGWDGSTRGGPLLERDTYVRRSLAKSADLIDVEAVAAAWGECLTLGVGEPVAAVWIHADLMPGNLLTRQGRLAAVIDLGGAGIGDPAVDLMPAWNLLSRGAREVFRDRLGVSDATWARGRAWAIVQAIGALPYYVETNPVMADTARETLAAVLEP
jgi:aminoglycoside phosphotransferase (APT) family kinase protein